LISILYDILWLVVHWYPWWQNGKKDGDVELFLRRVVIINTLVSNFIKLFVMFILWKISVDYTLIVVEAKQHLVVQQVNENIADRILRGGQ
jgi:hypothetical protein